MDTKTFFSIVGFLLTIGTFISLVGGGSGVLTGGVLMGTTSPINSTQLQELPVPAPACTNPIPFWCQITSITDSAGALTGWIGAGVNFIWSGIMWFVSFVAFFTGLGTLLNSGTLAIPQPLGYIVAIMVILSWVFVALEIIRRFKSAVLPS